MNPSHNSLVEPIATDPAPCAVCGKKRRCASGRLTRCLGCLKADVDRDRRQREAKASKKAGVAVMYLPHADFVAGGEPFLGFAEITTPEQRKRIAPPGRTLTLERVRELLSFEPETGVSRG